jgi:hypothetical protein
LSPTKTERESAPNEPRSGVKGIVEGRILGPVEQPATATQASAPVSSPCIRDPPGDPGLIPRRR